MISPHFLADLRTAIADEITEESTRLAGGMATDWSDYQRRTGVIAGMKKLDTIIETLTKDRK